MKSRSSVSDYKPSDGVAQLSLKRQEVSIREIMRRSPGEMRSRQILADRKLSPEDVRAIRRKIEGPKLRQFNEDALPHPKWGGGRG
jgi:hypothetical protein